METLEFQLNQYILITQQICELIENGSRNLSDTITRQMNVSQGIHDHITLMMENEEKQSEHLDQLTNIRENKMFRMCFLFKNKAQDFITLFSESHNPMLDFLSDLEKVADQLDSTKKASDRLTVFGSSVGIAGGVLSIAGILSPVTAGLSLVASAGSLGAFSAGISLITYFKERKNNNNLGKKATEVFTSFQKDVDKILYCINVAASTITDLHGVTTGLSVEKTFNCAENLVRVIIDILEAPDKYTVRKQARENVDNAGLPEVNASRRIPNLTTDVPETPKALTKAATGISVGLNALFIMLDVYFIYKSSRSLFKGSKHETAQVIRDRTGLWRSEVKAWENIHDHLRNGISAFQTNLEILNQPFYI